MTTTMHTSGQPGTTSRIAPGDTIATRELTTIRSERILAPAPDVMTHLQFRRYAGCPGLQPAPAVDGPPPRPDHRLRDPRDRGIPLHRRRHAAPPGPASVRRDRRPQQKALSRIRRDYLTTSGAPPAGMGRAIQTAGLPHDPAGHPRWRVTRSTAWGHRPRPARRLPHRVRRTGAGSQIRPARQRPLDRRRAHPSGPRTRSSSRPSRATTPGKRAPPIVISRRPRKTSTTIQLTGVRDRPSSARRT